MLHDYVVLCLAAAAAGAINAIAGGGTLLTFPALFAALGSTPAAAVLANATSTVALVPGTVAALIAYRREIQQERYWATLLLAPSFIGGLIGSVLVVALPEEWFEAAVPWLILAAASLFALQPQIAHWTGIGRPNEGPPSRQLIGAAIAMQFFVSVYGGYFGAGIGILMLTSLSLMGLSDIHRMNGIKTLLGFAINVVALVVFVADGKVHWPFALAMAVSSIIGGYLAAHFARRIDRRIVRAMVIAIGFSLAIYYFWRG